MNLILTAKLLLLPGGPLQDPIVTISDGYITEICTRETAEVPEQRAGTVLRSYPDAVLAPAYLDIHVHGAAGRDVMEATPEALRTVKTFLFSRGVGAFLPTTVTSTTERTLAALDGIAQEIEHGAQKGAALLGIHLEGPFLSPHKRGVHSLELLAQPSVSLFDRFWNAARGHIRLMTIAPELPGADELIAHATSLGVRCSLGHSDATASQAEAGVRAGARSATHMFNAMRSIGHREPGLAGYVLDNEELFAEIICDGIHVDPAMVRLFWKAKGRRRAILITDGISATGCPDGVYKLGGLQVQVERGRCTLAGQPEVLAGSVLTLDRAVSNFLSLTHAGLSESVALATRNPATLLGLDKEWGLLEAGRKANLTVLTATGEILDHFREGRPARSALQ